MLNRSSATAETVSVGGLTPLGVINVIDVGTNRKPIYYIYIYNFIRLKGSKQFNTNVQTINISC